MPAGWRVSTSNTGRPITSVAAHALGAGLPLPVPDLNAVLAVDDVEAHRQAVDDQADEAALLLDFPRLDRHFVCEIGRQLRGGEIGREKAGQDFEHAGAGVAPGREGRLEQAQPLALMDQRQAEHARGGRRKTVQRLERRNRLVGRR